MSGIECDIQKKAGDLKHTAQYHVSLSKPTGAPHPNTDEKYPEPTQH